jgi:hypothetical protein
MNTHSRRRFAFQVTGLAMLALIGGNAMSLEKPEYTVLYTDGDIEYRQYEAYLVSETVVQTAGGYGDAGNEGFRRLFNYISGANSSQAKIDMTAPVERMPSSEKIEMTAPVERSETADGWAVTFMLPSEYTLQTAPVPTDERVRIREVPGRLMAVLEYSGRWTDSNLVKRSAQLLTSVAAQSIETFGEVVSAAYDPPFMPPFLRRNEVMIEVDRLPETTPTASAEYLTVW